MSDNKTYSLNLSAQMILGIILSVLVPLGGAVYYGITLFNDLTSTIEEVKKMSSVETRIIVLEDRSRSTERPVVAFIFVGELVLINFVSLAWAMYSGVDFIVASQEVFSTDEMAIVASIIGFYFGSRTWEKK
jgi:hypothetical protein